MPRLTQKINVTMTPAQKAAVQRAAKAEGLSVSAWLRARIASINAQQGKGGTKA